MSNMVKHKFQSAYPDLADASKVRPSNWNEEHVFAGGTHGQFLMRDTGSSDGASWTSTIPAGQLTIAGQAIGDLIYANSATTFTRLADVAAGSYLRSGGVTTAPVWSTLILPNGATANRIPYATALNTWGDSAALTFDGAALRLHTDTGVLSFGTADDVVLSRQGADNLNLKRSTNAQVFNVWKTDDGSGNYSGLGLDSANMALVRFGSGTGANGDMSINNVGAGSIQFSTNGSTRWILSGGGGVDGRLIPLTTNVYDIGAVGFLVRTGYFGTSVVTPLVDSAGATLALSPGAGDIRWNKALVALGGGAAPTLGTIGGAGPAVAGQNTWLRLLDSAGVACWLPVWK